MCLPVMMWDDAASLALDRPTVDGGGDVHLYRGSTDRFIGDATQNRLATQLSERFFEEFRYRPPTSEVHSWQNSLRAMADVLRLADLTDQGILVELQLPLTSRRLDCLVTGSDRERGDGAVVVELKQWSEVGRSNVTDCVTVDMGGRERDRLHPSRQVERYQRYLQDTHPAFSDGAIGLDACAYLHNARYDPTSPLLDPAFATLVASHPAFAGDQVDDMATFLDARISGPDEGDILERIANTAFRPHKRLLDHVAKVIRNEPTFILLDEQLVAFNAILDEVLSAGEGAQPVAFLIEGGPGTGKSVIAVNLVAELSAKGKRSIYATGSKAFTENLRQRVGSRAGALFNYFRNLASMSEPFDVVILDEAHRIREVSTSRFTPLKDRTGKPQIEEILDAGRVSVFFIDDRQVVRPGEVGSTELIRRAAGQREIPLREYPLEAQFRANGSDSFIQWVDNTLGVARTPQVLWQADDPFDFRVVDTVTELERLIRVQHEAGASARLVAGFCWPWSNPLPSGDLVADVVVGDWRRPWNARAEAGRLAPGIPKSDYWATETGGIEQVGCVYTAQGFEFDYVGVIVGRDLVYRPGQGWLGQPEESKDSVVSRKNVTSDDFARYVKHTYRVLLTRGLRGCYVHFLDGPTRDFVLSRVEWASEPMRRAAEEPAPYG
jgi:uncharacterized protein